MSKSSSLSQPDIYLSFFMFTTDLKPDNSEYRKTVVEHIKKLQDFGYTGFEFPIAPPPPGTTNYAQDDPSSPTSFGSRSNSNENREGEGEKGETAKEESENRVTFSR